MNKTRKSEQKRGAKKVKSVKILGIGNSFSVDCMEYVYNILHSIGVEKIELGNLYIGGCPLALHCQNLRGDLPAYEYWENDAGEWRMTPDFKMGDAIKAKEWDFIFTQQYSGHSGMGETFGDLDELMAYVKANQKGNPQYGWQMTWAYAKDATHPAFVDYNNDQQSMYEAIVNAVKTKIVPRGDMKVIPSGTAIQNAREVLGDVLNRDGFHLDYNIGRYIAGLCVVKALVGLAIDNVTFAPEGVDEEKRKIAIAVANAACEKPFEVTK